MSDEKIVSFGPFRLNVRDELLFRGERRLHLRPRVARLLVYLVQNSGRAVSREELAQLLWDGRCIDVDQGLNSIVRSLREKLGDDSRRPTYLETIPTKGYRFVGRTKQHSARTTQSRVFMENTAVAGILGVLLFLAAIFHVNWTNRLSVLPVVSVNTIPADVRRIYLKGLEEYHAEQRNSSRLRFQKVVSMAPDFADGHLWLGKSKLDAWGITLDDAVASEPSIRRAIELDPGLADAYLFLGHIAMIRHLDATQAETYAAKTLSLDPTNVEARILLVDTRLAFGDPDGALSEIERINGINPLRLVPSGTHGWVLFMAEHYETAAIRCREAMHMNFERGMIHNCLYEAYFALGEAELARQHALEIMKFHKAAQSAIARVSELPSGGALRAYWQWFLEFADEHSSTRDRSYELAITNLRLGRNDAALKHLRHVVEQRQYPFIAFIASDPRLQAMRGSTDAQALFSLYRQERAGQDTAHN